MPSPPQASCVPRKRRVREQTREEILQAAERLFRKKGYYLATAEEIARDAGVAVGTIYNIIGSKERLYSEVLLTIARDLLKRLWDEVFSHGNAEEAMERLIQLRIDNYERYQLFFQLFFHHGPALAPDFNQLPQEVFESYYRYIERLGEFFRETIGPEGIQEYYAFYLALSFEGFINAFMGFRVDRGPARSLARITQFMKRVWIESMKMEGARGGNDPSSSRDTESRQIHITRYDLARLTDLIIVYRSFSQGYSDQHLKNLAKELNRAKIVQSSEIPPDVITMNSRVRLRDLRSGEWFVLTLVFPVDEKEPDHISILSPLGTAMIGYRSGDRFTVSGDKEAKRYRVEEVLYQPEAAGDFHL